jgi:Galactosyltransferase
MKLKHVLVGCCGTLALCWLVTTVYVLNEASNRSYHRVSDQDKGIIVDRHHKVKQIERQEPSKDHTSSRMSSVVIGITSTPTDRGAAQRDSVRRTWLQLASRFSSQLKLHVRFLVGLSSHCFDGGDASKCDRRLATLRDELARFDDLLLVDVADRYDTLVEKTVALHRWAAAELDHDYDYVIKTDDDVFVRLDALLETLEAMPAERLYYGFLWQRAMVFRSGKNAETEWPHDEYPTFASGVCNVMSADVSRHIGLGASLLRRYANEDTSIGIWLSALNVDYRHDKRLQAIEGICFETALTVHPLSPADLLRMYANLVDDALPLCASFRDDVCPIGEQSCAPGPLDAWKGALNCEDAYGCWLRVPRERRFDIAASFVDVAPAIAATPCDGDVNWLANGAVDATVESLGWMPFQQGFAVDVRNGMSDHRADDRRLGSLLVSTRRSVLGRGDDDGDDGSTRSMGAGQRLVVDQRAAEPFVASGWSKAHGVGGQADADYALFVDAKLGDGTSVIYAVPFDVGTHDWQFRVGVWMPPARLVSAHFIAMFRGHRGTAWFDELRFAPLSGCACQLARVVANMAALGNGPRSHVDRIGSELWPQAFVDAAGVVDTAANPYRAPRVAVSPKVELTRDAWAPAPRFFFVWHGGGDMTLRHRRAVEAVLRHHRDAHVAIYARAGDTSLHDGWPLTFWRRGFDGNGAAGHVRIVRYDNDDELTPLDLLRQHGGIYIDFDMLLLEPLDRQRFPFVALAGEPDDDRPLFCNKLLAAGLVAGALREGLAERDAMRAGIHVVRAHSAAARTDWLDEADETRAAAVRDAYTFAHIGAHADILRPAALSLVGRLLTDVALVDDECLEGAAAFVAAASKKSERSGFLRAIASWFSA